MLQETHAVGATKNPKLVHHLHNNKLALERVLRRLQVLKPNVRIRSEMT
jgi:hypothetical protein